MASILELHLQVDPPWNNDEAAGALQILATYRYCSVIPVRPLASRPVGTFTHEILPKKMQKTHTRGFSTAGPFLAASSETEASEFPFFGICISPSPCTVRCTKCSLGGLTCSQSHRPNDILGKVSIYEYTCNSYLMYCISH